MPFPYVLLLSIRSTYGDGVGGWVVLVLWATQPMDGWVHTTHNPSSHTTGFARMEPGLMESP